jgi:hypothetical protein
MNGGAMVGEAKIKFLRVTDTVKNWLWSFVQPNNIESAAEYKIRIVADVHQEQRRHSNAKG